MSQKKSSHTPWPLDKSLLTNAFAQMKKLFTPSKWGDAEMTVFLVAVGVAAAVILSAALRSGRPADPAAPAANVATKTAPAAPAPTTAPPASPRSAGKTPGPSPVTITGCLEADKDAFRLKDTTGEDAPRSRSWKSGFLKRSKATIEVIDTANRVKLPSHVGERVVVTGMLVDREMQVSSLRRVSASCNKEA